MSMDIPLHDIKRDQLEIGMETDGESPRGQVEFFENLKHEPEVLYTNYIVPTLKDTLTKKSVLMTSLRVIVSTLVVVGLLVSMAVFALPFIFIETPSKKIQFNQSGRCELIKMKQEKFKAVEILAPTTGLSPSNRAGLNSLLLLEKNFNKLFLKQVYEKNEELLTSIEKSKECNGVVEEFFDLNFGPWDRIDGNKSFIPSVKIKKPLGANFYPLDMTVEEFNNWTKTLSPDDHAKATGPHHVIKRINGKLELVSYADEFKTELTEISRDLKIAAGYMTDASLKKFLTERADAFLSNDYRASELSWTSMEPNTTFEVTLGPYETKEDALFGYKAAFTMSVIVVDQQETKEALQFLNHYQELHDNLPINSTYKTFHTPTAGPIVIGSVIFQAGFATQTIQSSAFNVHMYDDLISSHGTKKVVLMNIQQSKYNDLLSPLAKLVIGEVQQRYLSFDGYHTRTLCDQIIQGLGPQNITVNGKKTTVKEQLKEISFEIDMIKADSGSIWMLYYLLNQNKLNYQYTLKPELARDNFISLKDKIKRTIAVTYVAALFRKFRFGESDDTGRASAVILIHLIKTGAVILEKEIVEGTSQIRLSVDFGSFEFVIGELFGDILNIQASGDKNRADKLITDNQKMPTELEELKKHVDKSELPIDILPRFARA